MEAIVDGEVLSLKDLGRLPDGGTDEKAIRKVSTRALACLIPVLHRPCRHTMTDFQAHRGDFHPGLQAEPGRRVQEAASRRTGGIGAARQAHDKFGSAENGGVKRPLPSPDLPPGKPDYSKEIVAAASIMKRCP